MHCVAELCLRHHPWAPHTPVRGEDGVTTAREAVGVTALRRLAPPPRAEHQGIARPFPHWRSWGPSKDTPPPAPLLCLLKHPWVGSRCRGLLSHTRSSDALSSAACEGRIRPPRMEAHAVGQHSSILRKNTF